MPTIEKDHIRYSVDEVLDLLKRDAEMMFPDRFSGDSYTEAMLKENPYGMWAEVFQVSYN